MHNCAEPLSAIIIIFARLGEKITALYSLLSTANGVFMEKTALLKRLYGRAGHKGIMFLLYLVFFALHLAASAAAYLPSIDPNEFSSAALANMFIGGDWTAAMSRSDYFYGFLQAILYVPAMLVTKDPFLQYRLMLGINGLVMSFVPVIVYSCSRMLGMEKTWQSVFAAVCCGGWMTYVIHSKFIWNETAAMFLPWLVFYLLLRADRAETKSAKAARTLLLSLTAALSYCAHQRLFALILALSVTVVLVRLLFRRRAVNLPVFFISLVIFLAGATIANYIVQTELWGVSDPTALQNTAESFFAGLPSLLDGQGAERFLTALASQTYYFVTASWGLGALGISIAVTAAAGYFSARHKGREVHATPVTLLTVFTVLVTLFMLFISVCYRFGADNFETAQGTVLFGRYLDGVIPFTVLLVLTYVHIGDFSLVKIYGGIIAAAAVYAAFFFTGRLTVLNAGYATVSPMLGLYPVMFGESTESLVTSTGLTAAISCSLCLMAVFLVILSCAKKLKNVVVSGTVAAIALYSLCFGAFYYLPLSHTESVEKNSAYVQVSESLFNSTDAPPVTVYRGSRGCVMMLQYMNQSIKVYTADKPEDIRKDTYVVIPADVPLPFLQHDGIPLVPLGGKEEYRVYAYGERAEAYAHSQSGGEEEQFAPPR